MAVSVAHPVVIITFKQTTTLYPRFCALQDIVALYKDNSGAGGAPEGWAPPSRTVTPPSGTESEDEEAAEVVADAYMRVVFSSDDVVSHTVRARGDGG